MAEVGSGITIEFQTGFFAEVLSITHGAIQRPSVDATHQTSAQMEYIPGKIPDYGELNVEFAFDPKKAPPITAAPEPITVTYPDGSTWVITGFMQTFEITSTLEERMVGNSTLKFTGDLVVTPPP